MNLKLVLLPGLDGTGDLFQPLLNEIQEDINVFVVRYPSKRLLTYWQLVNYVAEQLPKNNPLIILAESFSGPLAVDLFSSTHQNVKGVIFCATFAKVPRPFLLQLAKILPLSAILGLPIPHSMIRFFCVGKEAPDSLITQFQAVLHKVEPLILTQRLKMLANVNVISALTHIKIPCCYIQATDDRLVPSNNIKPFQTILPHLIIHKINGPHFILQAKPVACAKAIKEFLKHISKMPYPLVPLSRGE
jgi:pimeloyl-[acyl-carrier protein] methyl ester esterase